MSEFDITGKGAIITGGGTGIGRGTALEFANAAGAIATLKKGAIPSLPGVLQIQRFIRKNKTGGI